MKFLLIDQDGLSLSLAWRAAQAGHEVRWFVKPNKEVNKDTGKGFKGITKIDNWVPSVMWADLVLPTGNADFLERLDFFKKKGAHIFGPSVASAELEIDRGKGMEFMEAHGIKLAPYETFNNLNEAIKHLQKTAGRFVFKTMGDEEDKSMTYVSKSSADLLGWINRLKKQPKGEVMLQTFIDGIEMGVSRWMGSAGFIGPYNESFEHKKLMSGNYGPNTGEMGTVAAYTDDSALGDDTLANMEKDLLQLGHLGDTAIGFMIAEDGTPYPTEFTMRNGWPIMHLMIAACKDDPILWMKDALEGNDGTNFNQEIGTCLVLAHGNFPSKPDSLDDVTGIPVFGVTRGNKKYLHPQDIKIDIMPDMDGEKLVERPMWNTTGQIAAVITGFGKDVKQSTERAYNTAKQLHVANPILRDDVGEKLEETLPKLHKHGYATHFNFELGKKT